MAEPPPYRDATYYYDDGNLTLFVEDVLFKIHGSRLSGTSELFRDIFQLPQSPGGMEGTDKNPVPLPGVMANQFRNLLYMFYASPVDPEYITFLSGIPNEKNGSAAAFRRYLDIASLSRRFLMHSTEHWACEQLDALVERPPFFDRPPLDHLHDALNYAKLRSTTSNNKFEREIRSASAAAMCVQSKGRHCEQVYRGQVAQDDRILYGFSYVSLLCLKFDSPQWNAMTKDKRLLLYVSQVRLTPLPNTLPFQSLITANELINSVGQTEGQLSLCQSSLRLLSSHWGSDPDTWKSEKLRLGLTKIRGLPSQRQKLAKNFASNPCECAQRCGVKVLARVDDLIETLIYALLDFREALSNDYL